MRYDFVDLKIFLTLARTLNVTHTAEEVHLTTSAVSLRLKKFEDALGVQLFERGPRGLSMTAAGLALKPHAVAILGSLTSIETDLRGYQNPSADTISIATNTTGLQNIFCHAGRLFLHEHPVKLRILDMRSAAAVDAVLRGTVDLGFGLKTFADLHTDRLEVIPFMEDTLVCIIPESHPLADRDTLDYATVLQYDYLSLQEQTPLAKAMRERAQNRGFKFEPIVQLPNFDQMVRYVESGLGAAILPQSALREIAKFGDDEPRLTYRKIPLSDPFATRTLAFSLRKDGPNNERCRELIGVCRRVMGEQFLLPTADQKVDWSSKTPLSEPSS